MPAAIATLLAGRSTPAALGIRAVLVAVLLAQFVGKLGADDVRLGPVLAYAGVYLPYTHVLAGLLITDVVLIALLTSGRTARAGLLLSGVAFAALALFLLGAGLVTPAAECRGLALWEGVGAGPLALTRSTALAGLALLGAAWPPLRPAAPGLAVAPPQPPAPHAS